MKPGRDDVEPRKGEAHQDHEYRRYTDAFNSLSGDDPGSCPSRSCYAKVRASSEGRCDQREAQGSRYSALTPPNARVPVSVSPARLTCASRSAQPRAAICPMQASLSRTTVSRLTPLATDPSLITRSSLKSRAVPLRSTNPEHRLPVGWWRDRICCVQHGYRPGDLRPSSVFGGIIHDSQQLGQRLTIAIDTNPASSELVCTFIKDWTSQPEGEADSRGSWIEMTG